MSAVCVAVCVWICGNCVRNPVDFCSGESTGSVGVVTINMPRIAYLSKNEEEFYQRLDKMMDIAARSLHIKRVVISRLLEEKGCIHIRRDISEALTTIFRPSD